MISAKIVADSICNGNRITTMEVVFPRFILAELNTHRLFSRNSASSRAIPFAKMVKEVEENPFIPIAWQKDHKGMQGTEYIEDNLSIQGCISEWLKARDNAITQAKRLSYYSTTKQLCNRLLEPFMWHKVLITATEWDNFFELRCSNYQDDVVIVENNKTSSTVKIEAKSKKEFKSKLPKNSMYNYSTLTDLDWLKLNKGQSEIHMMALAEAMWDARNESVPKELQPGEWHIPYGDNILYTKTGYTEDGLDYQIHNDEKDLVKISTARCARLSYQTLGDNPKVDYNADIKLHDSLLSSGHFSPFEHCAKAMSSEEYIQNVKGLRNQDAGYDLMANSSLGWCNNFRGWIQYRYLIENK